MCLFIWRFDVLLVEYIVSVGSNVLDWLVHLVFNWVKKALLGIVCYMFASIIWFFFVDVGVCCRSGWVFLLG